MSFPLFCIRVSILCGLIVALPTTSFSQSVYEQLEVRSPLPTPNNITHLEYANGKFLATTDRNGVVISSDDGMTWQTHKTPHPNSLADIAYGNGLYCVTTSGSGSVFFSTDLTNWTTVFSSKVPSNNDNVYFHNGLFFFGGAQFGANDAIVTSSDGVAFNSLEVPGEDTVRDIVFANNQYVAVGDNLQILTSPDGVNWTLRPTGADIEGLGQGLLSVRYLNSLFVVGGKSNTLLTSPDGITWTQREFSEDSSWFWDSWYNAGTYYFPGRQGKIWTTTDFTSWTSIDLNENDDVYNIVNGGGITVASGRGGNLFSSTDLLGWTSRKSGYSNNFSDVAFGNGRFVASDYDGNVIGSSDGITWEDSFVPGIDVNWFTVVFADDKFVAMSSRGEWILSPSGLINTWSLPSAEIAGGVNIERLRYLNDKWFIVGQEGMIRSSTNLTSWDVHDIATTNDFRDIAFANGMFIVVGQGGELHTSSDGVNWTSRDSTATSDLGSVAYGNGTFVVMGSSSTGLTSADGISWSSAGQSNPPFFPLGLEFRDGRFEALDTQGRVKFSSDGLSWSSAQTLVGTNLSGIATSSEKMVAVGQSGTILSGDLIPPKTLTVDIAGEGTVEVSPEGPSFQNLSEVTLTAVGTPDFAFSNWSGDASGNTNPLVVTMDADKAITANFVLALTGYELWRYLNFTSEERADDEVSGPGADYDEDGLTNNDEFLFDTNPKEFDPPRNLVVNIEGEGQVTISPTGGGPYTFMSEVIITAVETVDSPFSNWSGDASGNVNPLTVVMDGDKTITANFETDFTGFLLWRSTRFTPEERADANLSSAQADFDKDGLSNFEEYLRGSDPKFPDSENSFELDTIEISGSTYLIVKYTRDKAVVGVAQRVEVGDDLVEWLSGPTHTEIVEVADNGDGTERVTVRILRSIDALPSWFVRLALEEIE